MIKPYYKDDWVTIYNNDCMKIMKKFSDDSIDFCFADPPYGRNKADWDDGYPKFEFEKELLRLSQNGVVVTCGEQNIVKCINRLGNDYKAPIYGWNKNGMTRGTLGFQNVILAICGGKIKKGQNFIQFSIKDLTRKYHPSPKPIEYIRAIIERFTNRNDMVLDPFLGSGTTTRACKDLGRKCIDIEINKEYCDIAVDRLSQEVLDFNEDLK